MYNHFDKSPISWEKNWAPFSEERTAVTFTGIHCQLTANPTFPKKKKRRASTKRRRDNRASLNKEWILTRSSWLNCALRDDEAVYWVSTGHYGAVAVGNWWYWVSRGHLFMPLYIAQSGDMEGCHACLTDWLTHWQLWEIVLLSSL